MTNRPNPDLFLTVPALARPSGANDRWSLRFERAPNGCRRLVIFDDGTRERLAVIAHPEISDDVILRSLDRVVAERGSPRAIISDCELAMMSSKIRDW